MFPTTHASILIGLLEPQTSGESWQRFQSLYEQPIRRWFTSRGLQASDVDDQTQEMLVKLFVALTKQQFDAQRGSFRAWLGAVIRNALVDFFRKNNRRPEQTMTDDVCVAIPAKSYDPPLADEEIEQLAVLLE